MADKYKLRHMRDAQACIAATCASPLSLPGTQATCKFLRLVLEGQQPQHGGEPSYVEAYPQQEGPVWHQQDAAGAQGNDEGFAPRERAGVVEGRDNQVADREENAYGVSDRSPIVPGPDEADHEEAAEAADARALTSAVIAHYVGAAEVAKDKADKDQDAADAPHPGPRDEHAGPRPKAVDVPGHPEKQSSAAALSGHSGHATQVSLEGHVHKDVEEGQNGTENR
mmetsp:Transcript_70159/g.227075  ORF Transcript_70159/g.227075 Transcript_70159/m.227075 type:complete len:225 (-) Transcript_70159:1283-1957(-)